MKIFISHPDAWKSVHQKTGKQYHVRTVVRCPFHDERTPSLMLDGWSHNDEPQATSGKYVCLSCGVKGKWEQDFETQFEYVGEHGQDVPAAVVLAVSLT